MEEKRFRRTQEETRTPGKSFAGNLALGSNLGRERIGQVAGLLQRRYGQWNGFAHASALGRHFIEKFLGRKTASTKEQASNDRRRVSRRWAMRDSSRPLPVRRGFAARGDDSRTQAF